ncbi:hypothetical protein FQN55_000344 [Onygenales sp. PD_40]|nr:hypothetical protein FQN55_000344 [Onygenales sp. PD_40]KAK2794793.1 hypothetical protein FQN52_007563 [Onygenales sp. PD_12]
MANWYVIIALAILAVAIALLRAYLQLWEEGAVGMAPSVERLDGLGGKEDRLEGSLTDFEAHLEDHLRSLEGHMRALEQPAPAPTGGQSRGSGSSTSLA